MIPALLPALERHGRLKPTSAECALLVTLSAATIDRMLTDVKVAAAGGRRRRVGFYSAIRGEVPIRTFNAWGTRHQVFARSTWPRTAGRMSPVRSSRR